MPINLAESPYDEAPVVKAVRELSSGTIATLSNVVAYEEIDALRESVARSTIRNIKRGMLESHATWQEAWNLYKVQLDTWQLANGLEV